MKKLMIVFAAALCFAVSFSSFASAQEKAVSAPKNLFAERDLNQWDFHCAEKDVKVSDVYSFNDDGVLTCKGKPNGYIATKSVYKNFKASVEFAWPEGVEPSNSGIFLRINAQPQGNFLPRGIEVQLKNGSVGDLWAFHGMRIGGPKNRHTDNPNSSLAGAMSGVSKIEEAEKQPGQWNQLDILVVDSLVVVSVNGKIVNWTNEAETTPGKLGLQSEGGPVKFRNCVVTELK